MKPGKEYEHFAHEKFERLFPGAVVTFDDHIVGKESGISRQIDVSIRMTVEDTEVLYIVQCKDWKKAADIKALGEFASVVQDVGAAKGLLLCTAGFAKTNHQYALTKGIELFTIEDIDSDKWSVEIQIPFLYIQKQNNFVLSLEIIFNEELVEKNHDQQLVLEVTTGTRLTTDGGVTTKTVDDYLMKPHEPGSSIKEGVPHDFTEPGLHIRLVDVWVPLHEFSIVWTVSQRYFVKYLDPKEYSQLTDHVRETVLPLHLRLEDVGMKLDDTFIELPDEGQPPVFNGLYLEVEENNILDIT